MSYVTLQNLTKRFDDITAVQDLDVEVERGEFVSLLGPSGCGKTTTLRMIAGLVTPTEGEIWINDRNVTDVPTYERNVGMVFQHYALFPHKTVGENVMFPLKMDNVEREERERRAREALELVRLPNMMDRSSAELSGGQQQRVALARALVYEPDVLLMDEPLSALDRVLRQEMRLELKRIQNETGITTIYVTHDQMEAFSLSDRVIVLENGRLSQEGAPIDIYESPSSAFVADFIGRSSEFGGIVEREKGITQLVTDEGLTLQLPDVDRYEAGERLSAFLRAEKLSLSDEERGHPNEFEADIVAVNYLGERTQFICELAGGQEIVVSVQGFTDMESYDRGETAYVTASPEEIVTTRGSKS